MQTCLAAPPGATDSLREAQPPVMPESTLQTRRERITRAEALLDQWLDLFEANLQHARDTHAQSNAPVKLHDFAKLTDLANVVTITRRAYELEHLAQRIADSHGEREPTELDLQLLLDAIPEDAQDQ